MKKKKQFLELVRNCTDCKQFFHEGSRYVSFDIDSVKSFCEEKSLRVGPSFLEEVTDKLTSLEYIDLCSNIGKSEFGTDFYFRVN